MKIWPNNGKILLLSRNSLASLIHSRTRVTKSSTMRMHLRTPMLQCTLTLSTSLLESSVMNATFKEDQLTSGNWTKSQASSLKRRELKMALRCTLLKKRLTLTPSCTSMCHRKLKRLLPRLPRQCKMWNLGWTRTLTRSMRNSILSSKETWLSRSCNSWFASSSSPLDLSTSSSEWQETRNRKLKSKTQTPTQTNWEPLTKTSRLSLISFLEEWTNSSSSSLQITRKIWEEQPLVRTPRWRLSTKREHNCQPGDLWLPITELTMASAATTSNTWPMKKEAVSIISTSSKRTRMTILS